MPRGVRVVLAAIPLLLASAAEPPPSETAARIAAAERSLPWFWSPAAEGLTDISYTYEAFLTRRVMRGGREVVPAVAEPGVLTWRSLQLERIPLEWGAFMRCLSVDGASPCRDEWNREFDRQVKSRDALTAADRARIDAGREQRRAIFRSPIASKPTAPASFGFHPAPATSPPKAVTTECWSPCAAA